MYTQDVYKFSLLRNYILNELNCRHGRGSVMGSFSQPGASFKYDNMRQEFSTDTALGYLHCSMSQELQLSIFTYNSSYIAWRLRVGNTLKHQRKNKTSEWHLHILMLPLRQKVISRGYLLGQFWAWRMKYWPEDYLQVNTSSLITSNSWFLTYKLRLRASVPWALHKHSNIKSCGLL